MSYGGSYRHFFATLSSVVPSISKAEDAENRTELVTILKQGLLELREKDPRLYKGLKRYIELQDYSYFNLSGTGRRTRENPYAKQIEFHRDKPVSQSSFEWCEEGEKYLHSGKYLEAASAYRIALEIDPRNIVGQHGLSISLFNVSSSLIDKMTPGQLFRDIYKIANSAIQADKEGRLRSAVFRYYLAADLISYLLDATDDEKKRRKYLKNQEDYNKRGRLILGTKILQGEEIRPFDLTERPKLHMTKKIESTSGGKKNVLDVSPATHEVEVTGGGEGHEVPTGSTVPTTEEERTLSLLRKFRGGIPVQLSRVSELLGLPKKKVERLILDAISESPGLGVYYEMEQVFVRSGVKVQISSDPTSSFTDSPCVVCRKDVYSDVRPLVRCIFCDTPYHYQHLEPIVHVNGKCAVCRNTLDESMYQKIFQHFKK